MSDILYGRYPLRVFAEAMYSLEWHYPNALGELCENVQFKFPLKSSWRHRTHSLDRIGLHDLCGYTHGQSPEVAGLILRSMVYGCRADIEDELPEIRRRATVELSAHKLLKNHYVTFGIARRRNSPIYGHVVRPFVEQGEFIVPNHELVLCTIRWSMHLANDYAEYIGGAPLRNDGSIRFHMHFDTARAIAFAAALHEAPKRLAKQEADERLERLASKVLYMQREQEEHGRFE